MRMTNFVLIDFEDLPPDHFGKRPYLRHIHILWPTSVWGQISDYGSNLIVGLPLHFVHQPNLLFH